MKKFTCVTAAALAGLLSAAHGREGRQILSATGVRGGLVVHLGCGPSTSSGQAGALTAALRADDGYVVHGLAVDPANVPAAREAIRRAGLYGPVSIDRLSGGRLPYVDNLVNLVVAETLGEVTREEVLRVLCPGGVAYVRRDGRWTLTRKARPKDIDEWTHYLHGPDNNAVAADTVVGPPRRLQWQCGPKWTRHHDKMSSLSALVSTGGRIFYILDEGLTASIYMPSRWALIARDAFNGKRLWRRKIDTWYTRFKGLKGGSGSGPIRALRRLSSRVVGRASAMVAPVRATCPSAAAPVRPAATGLASGGLRRDNPLRWRRCWRGSCAAAPRPAVASRVIGPPMARELHRGRET